MYIMVFNLLIAQLAGAVEYTDCIFEEGSDSSDECPVCNTKQFDSEAPLMLELC